MTCHTSKATLFVLVATCFAVQLTVIEARRELNTFEAIRDFVRDEFGVVSASFDVKSCEGPKSPQLDNMIYVEHLNDVWLYGKKSDGSEVLRATDISLEGKWIYVHTVLTNKGEVSVNVVDFAGGDLKVLSNVTVVCKIGEGAKFVAQNDGVDREEFENYEELKAAVLSGRELVARAEVSLCPGPNWPKLGIETFQAGYKIKEARIENEGTAEEAMRLDVSFFNDEYSSIVTSPLALENVAHTIKPSGSARIVPGAIDMYTFKVDHWFSIGYNCTVGSSYRVSAPKSVKTVKKYNDYKGLEQAVKEGQTISAVMDSRLCDWEGDKPDNFPEVVMSKFSPWVHGVDKEVYGTFVEFFSLTFRSNPKKIQEKFWVFDNNTVLYEVLDISIDPVAGKSQKLSSARCKMGCSIKFTSSGSPKEEIGCVAGLKAAALRSKYLTWLGDYSKCEGPKFVFDAHGGGLLVSLAIDSKTGIMHSSGNAISTFLASGEAVRVQQPVTINPDGKVTIVAETFVADATFKQVGETAVFNCKLGESVKFFE